MEVVNMAKNDFKNTQNKSNNDLGNLQKKVLRNGRSSNPY